MDNRDVRSIRAALREGSAVLRAAGLETPWLDAVVLLCHALGIQKERLFARMEDQLPAGARRTYEDALGRRASGEPVSYIRGFKEFYGREFLVDHRVLAPRPDTEALIEAALEVIDTDPGITTVHDCCTGSGCIAITLAAERPRLRVSASDISAAALEVCRQNVRRLAAGRVRLCQSDLLQTVAGSFDLIVANPPYITDDEVKRMIDNGWPEPELALAGGQDGLDLVRRLVTESIDHLSANRYLMLEGAFDQRASVFDVFQKNGLRGVYARRDLAGRDRVYVGRKILVNDDPDAGGV